MKALIEHNSEPFIGETPPDMLNENYYTPNNAFFVLNHGPVPAILEEDFSLYVMGKVHRPLRLTLHEVMSKFTKVHISATLKCVNNRKIEFDKVKFID